MGVWKSVGQQVGSIAKQAAQAIVQEPVEIIKNAVGVSDNQSQENQGMEAIEQGSQTQQQTTTDDANNPKGFKTKDDFLKYQQLSGRKDEMELAILRKRLFQENALDTNIESGMQKASQEYEQKEQQRKQVDENKKEEKKMEELQVKKQEEDIALKQATESSSAENKAWGAG